MTERKYKFSIDEKAPNIPDAPAFQSVLSVVKTKLPWYKNSFYWGGVATLAIVVVAGIVLKPNFPDEPKSKFVQNTVSNSEPVIADSGTLLPIIEETKPIFEPVQAAFYQEKIENVNDPGVIRETDEQATDNVDFFANDAIAAQPRTFEFLDNAGAINLPFDTIYINISELPKTYKLGENAYVMVPKFAFKETGNSYASGTVMLLYREISDAAAMIASHCQMDAGSKTLENNGAFEIRFRQNNYLVMANPSAPILVSYRILSPSAAFTGYRAATPQGKWQPMAMETFATNTNDPYTTQYDSIPKKRSFWEWFTGIFTGKKLEWNAYEKVGQLNLNATDKNAFRTFEIVEEGVYASGRKANFNPTSVRKIQFYSSSGEKLSPRIYQIYLNYNIVKTYVADKDGFVEIPFAASDRCIFIVPTLGSNALAVLDANGFDSLIKNGTLEKVPLKTNGSPVVQIEELRKVITRYSNQQPMAH